MILVGSLSDLGKFGKHAQIVSTAAETTVSLPDPRRVKGAIQIRKLIGLYCIASSVFVFGLAVVIQGAFAGAMLEATWLQFLFAETTLFIGPILLFVGGLEACIPQARRMRLLPLGSCALLLFYVGVLHGLGLAKLGFFRPLCWFW